MRIAHHQPPGSFWDIPESDLVDADYEATVQVHTSRSEREYRRLVHRLAKAEAKLSRARKAHAKKNDIAVLVYLVEIRRAELEDYRRLMVAVPASAEHRGRKSFRPVPPTQSSLIGRAS